MSELQQLREDRATALVALRRAYGLPCGQPSCRPVTHRVNDGECALHRTIGAAIMRIEANANGGPDLDVAREECRRARNE